MRVGGAQRAAFALLLASSDSPAVAEVWRDGGAAPEMWLVTLGG